MYKVKLPHFEGPLDLLLFFIKRDELDIYDIPISKITKEYMEYIEFIKELDLETAGDFIFMASTLMQIKVKMLLPKEIDEKGEEIDPRNELVNALLEYKKYKEMSEELFDLESIQSKMFFRGNFKFDEFEEKPELDLLLKNITIYDLMKAFNKAIKNKPKEKIHQVVRSNISIEEQITFINKQFEHKKRLVFSEFLTLIKEKMRLIVTFIAILELIKSGNIILEESEDFNDFVLVSKNG